MTNSAEVNAEHLSVSDHATIVRTAKIERSKSISIQRHSESIFPLNRTAHFRQRIITSNLGDRYISCTQCPGNDRGCVFDSKCLAKPLSISLGHHSIHRGSSCSTPFAMLSM
jgi:hypothetical protein